jgi:hypothetical protein
MGRGCRRVFVAPLQEGDYDREDVASGGREAVFDTVLGGLRKAL